MSLLSVGDQKYTNWGITNNELEPVDDTKKCAKICSSTDCDYTWRVTDCTDSLKYICMQNFKCPLGWVGWDNSCYKLETTAIEDSKNYDALLHCDSRHNALPFVPNSKDESLFMASYIKGFKVSQRHSLTEDANIVYVTFVGICAE